MRITIEEAVNTEKQMLIHTIPYYRCPLHRGLFELQLHGCEVLFLPRGSEGDGKEGWLLHDQIPRSSNDSQEDRWSEE